MNDETRQTGGACAEGVDRAPLPPTLERWTGALLNRAAQRVQERFESGLEPLGIRPKHYGVLALLENGPLTQIEIGRGLWVDRTTMVALIDDLERLGLVERERHPEDRRAYAITLTDRGREMLSQATGVVAATQEECFAALSRTEQEQLRALLAKLL
jgi:DNA-binding MarR family transcriptional regulator